MSQSDRSSSVAVDYRTRLVASLARVDAREWDALLGDDPYPFARHAFLHALEATGCVGPGTGWQPSHLCLHDRSGALCAAAPMYLKSHSYGEYVFDWAWADAYMRHGLSYYPKALVAIPFTPVPGPRLLARDAQARLALAHALRETAARIEVSSLHVLLPSPADADALAAAGLMRRRGVQFHWSNPGYADFEQYLASLTQPKRKKIRAERRKVEQAGVRLQVLEGPQVEPAHWRFFERCYRRTYALHHSTPYLNLAFFERLGATMPDNVLLVLAHRASRPVAASLLLRDPVALYGRYWGATEFVDSLHFEASYYRPIEYAIERGLRRFEGGAQGEHKMARGFAPVATCSYHWLAHPAFADAIERFLEREADGIDAYLDELTERLPLRTAEGRG